MRTAGRSQRKGAFRPVAHSLARPSPGPKHTVSPDALTLIAASYAGRAAARSAAAPSLSLAVAAARAATSASSAATTAAAAAAASCSLETCRAACQGWAPGPTSIKLSRRFATAAALRYPLPPKPLSTHSTAIRKPEPLIPSP